MINGIAKSDAPKRVILLVDDEPLLRTILADLMDEAGYAVLEADSGTAALRMLAERPQIALLITDFSMPGLNGIDLIRAAQDARPGLPAILLTGYAGDPGPTEMVAVARGKFEILPKPIDEPVLMMTIESLLGDNATVL